MRGYSTHLLHTLSVASIAIGLHALMACGNDDAGILPADATEETRTLVLSMPLSSEITAQSNPQVFLYRTDNDSLVATLSVSVNLQSEDGSMLLQGFLPDSCGLVTHDTLHCRAVVLANCPTTTGATDDFRRLTYNIGDEQTPLFGLSEIHQPINSRLEVLCPTIGLLRASALVTLQLSGDMKQQGFNITEAQIPTCNEMGYCTPACDIDYRCTEAIPQQLLCRPNATPFGPVSLQQITDGNWTTCVADCESTLANPIAIHIGLMSPTSHTVMPYTIYFKDYQHDLPLDIVRGNHYVFTIRGISTELSVSLEVEDWTDVVAEDVIFK